MHVLGSCWFACCMFVALLSGYYLTKTKKNTNNSTIKKTKGHGKNSIKVAGIQTTAVGTE